MLIQRLMTSSFGCLLALTGIKENRGLKCPTQQEPAVAKRKKGAQFDLPVQSQGWKAFSLRIPYLSLLICVSIGLFVALEVLRQSSNRNQGVAHFAAPENIKTAIFFVYNYLPTVLGVMYSIMWSFIDADVKRLEPYFQLRSKICDADILLVDYTFYSAFTVPFRALKRKHMIIAATSLTYLLVSFTIPAALGTLFTLDRVTIRHQQMPFQYTGGIHETHRLYESNAMDQITAVLVTNGTAMPPWTTFDYAVQPFKTDEDFQSRNDTLIAETPVAYAETNCHRFEVQSWSENYTCCVIPDEFIETRFIAHISASLEVPNAHGSTCQISISLSTMLPIHFPWPIYLTDLWVPSDTSFQTGTDHLVFNVSSQGIPEYQPLTAGFRTKFDYYDSEGSNYLKRNIESSCPSNPRLFGAVQFKYDQSLISQLNDFNLENLTLESPVETAQSIQSVLNSAFSAELSLRACDTEYFSTLAEVEVQGSDGTILNVKPRSSQRSLLSREEFNNTAFESILDYGTTSDILAKLNMASPLVGQDFFNTPVMPLNISSLDASALGNWAIDQQSHLSFANLLFNYGLSVFTGSFLADDAEISAFDEELGLCMAKMYKLMFACAFSDKIRHGTTDIGPVGFVDQQVIALLINPSFSIFVQVVILIATIVLLYIAVSYYRRESVLQSDPESLSAQLSLITDLFTETKVLSNLFSGADRKNTADLQKILQSWQTQFDRTSGLKIQPRLQRDNKEKESHYWGETVADPVPFWITKIGIFLTTVALFAVFLAIIVLWCWSSHMQGFVYHHEFSSFNSQLLWSFLPALVATLIEACWITIHRDMSILESWAQLKKPAASARSSLSLRYSSRPPLLVLLLSVKRKHFLLSLVSCFCVAASLLNISMASLFAQSFINRVQIREVVTTATTTELPYESLDESSVAQLVPVWSLISSQQGNKTHMIEWTTETHSFVPVQRGSVDSENIAESIEANFTSNTLGIGSNLLCREYPSSEDLLQQGLGLWIEEPQRLENIIRGRARHLPKSPLDNSGYACDTMFSIQLDLPSIYFHEPRAVQLNESGMYDPWITSQLPDKWLPKKPIGCLHDLVLSHTDTQSGAVNFYLCEAAYSVEQFNIVHSIDGRILSAEKSQEQNNTIINQLQHVPEFGLRHAVVWFMEVTSTTTRTVMSCYDISGLLMARLNHQRNISSIPELASRIFAQSFATWFSIYRQNFLQDRGPGDPSLSMPSGTVNTRELRIMPSDPAFGLSTALVAIYIIGYISIIVRRRHRYAGPRMPKSIGSIIPWVIYSRMLDDFRGLNTNSKERDTVLEGLSHKYGFGRFRDSSGRVRLGIEYEELLLARGAFGDY